MSLLAVHCSGHPDNSAIGLANAAERISKHILTINGIVISCCFVWPAAWTELVCNKPRQSRYGRGECTGQSLADKHGKSGNISRY